MKKIIQIKPELKTCETCKHWDRSFECDLNEQDKYEYKLFDLRQCKNTPPLFDATAYTDDYDEIIVDAYKHHKSFVMDGEGYRAVLLTKKDFGCVSHEEIENNEKDHTN